MTGLVEVVFDSAVRGELLRQEANRQDFRRPGDDRFYPARTPGGNLAR
jgi:hypothetical protein